MEAELALLVMHSSFGSFRHVLPANCIPASSCCNLCALLAVQRVVENGPAG